MKMSERAFQ